MIPHSWKRIEPIEWAPTIRMKTHSESILLWISRRFGLQNPPRDQGSPISKRRSYSKMAALADLRSPNQLRARQVHRAVDGYRAFLKLHPNHEEAAVPMFKIGESYYQQIPGDCGSCHRPPRRIRATRAWHLRLP